MTKIRHINPNPSKILILFLIFWLILAILQSVFTPLIHDEAYYWMYSRYPDWGYFDHPPLLALLIKAGSILPHAELGVRACTVVLSTASIFLLYKILQAKNLLLFLAIISSVIIIHIGSFIAVPDISLVFFTCLFFYLLKKFLQEEKTVYALSLGLCMALMLYSKYHGILVIAFTILACPALIRSKKAWLAAIFALLIFSPHILWQFQHDFITPDYQLTGRKSDFEWMNILNYIGGQLVIYGPLTGLLLFWKAFSPSAITTPFERILKFNLIGIFAFFFVMCFRGTVEANWTAPAFIPLIYFSYRGISRSEKLKKAIYLLAVPSIIFIMAFRVFLAHNFLPVDLRKETELHGWKEWAEKIEAEAGTLPVIFFNTYQEASKYSFYTDGEGYSVNNYHYAGNQYDLWDFERKLRGKPAFIVFKYEEPMVDSFLLFKDEYIHYEIDSNFISYSNIKIECRIPQSDFQKKKTYPFRIKLINNGEKEVQLKGKEHFFIKLAYGFFDENYQLKQEEIVHRPEIQDMILKEQYTDTMHITMPEKPGEYTLRIGIKSGWMGPGNNSPAYKVNVE